VDSTDRTQLEFLRLEVTGKLDLTNAELRSLTKEVQRFNDDHEKRVRSLERWKYAIPASALLILAAFLGGRVA